MSLLAEKLADKLAAETIKHINKTGDEDIVAIIAQTLEDSSQTLQEAFVTSIRVQRAAIRAHSLLVRRSKEFATKGDTH